MAVIKQPGRLRWQLLRFAGVIVLLGIPLGVVWAKFALRPGYTLSQDLVAGMSERALANVFAADALFVLLAAISGLIIGVVAWCWFNTRGWWVSVLAVVGGFAEAIVMWQLGLAVAPPTFDERLATAVAGDVIQIDLALQSLVALLVAPFFAITPVMLLAAFWPERPPTQDRRQLPRRVATVD